MIRSDETTEVEKLAEQAARYVWKIEDGGTHWVCALTQYEAILFHALSCEMTFKEYSDESLEEVTQCLPTEQIIINLDHEEPIPDLEEFPAGITYQHRVIVEPRMYLHWPKTHLIATTEY